MKALYRADDDDIAAFDDEPQEIGGLLKRPPYPALARQEVQQLENMNEQTPEAMSDSSRSRAIQALEEYPLESARPLA